MPAVTGLLASSHAMIAVINHQADKASIDTKYLDFIQEHVSPSLASLALCVGHDTLWKPLVHKILMTLRDKTSLVRLAALKTLYKLFVEVGDEFLILLPECLPFLSELLEDSSADVVDNTNNCIRYIEELSGEKLDDYLK